MWEYGTILAILTAVGYWIFRPLFRPEPLEMVSPIERESRGKVLEQRKEEVYEAIKEMDFDYGMGKISEDDYQGLKSQYKAKALEIFKELDALEGGGHVDAAIEREVQQLREKGKRTGDRGNGEETDARKLNFCTQCGRKVTPEEAFCRGCGVRLDFPQGERLT